MHRYLVCSGTSTSRFTGVGPLAEVELAFIAVGSNIDRPKERLAAAASALALVGPLRALSSVYLTEPVGGPSDQPPFLNGVLALEPRLEYRWPERILEALLEIERTQGRIRRERWGPRSLDLDLLSFGDRVLNLPSLTLPHPRMMERAFVLAPLCEIAPEWRHPVTTERACEALMRFQEGGVVRTDVGWNSV